MGVRHTAREEGWSRAGNWSLVKEACTEEEQGNVQVFLWADVGFQPR